MSRPKVLRRVGPTRGRSYPGPYVRLLAPGVRLAADQRDELERPAASGQGAVTTISGARILIGEIL
jgi:hypothetical protein